MTAMDVGDLRRYAKSTEGLVDELVGGYVRAFHDECIDISLRSVPAAEAVGDLLRAAFGSMEDNRGRHHDLAERAAVPRRTARIRLP